MTFVCVLTDGPGSPWGSPCWNCGGSTSAIDPDTGEAGPFPGDARYCSEDCYADAQQENERWRLHHQRTFGICPACGFDRQEHDDHCGPVLVALDPFMVSW